METMLGALVLLGFGSSAVLSIVFFVIATVSRPPGTSVWQRDSSGPEYAPMRRWLLAMCISGAVMLVCWVLIGVMAPN